MEREPKMRILITGALGHIGSKLIHNIEPGEFEEVRLIDNMLTQRYASLFNLPNGVKFKFYEEDILKVDFGVLLNGIDCVIHLAAITDAAGSFNRRDEIEKVNYDGTKRVAEACIKTHTNLLFPSTTSVYGSQSEQVDETCPIEKLQPQSPYAEYKLKSEQMLQEMGKNEGLQFVTCRFGTIFGTSIGMRFHTAVNKFCWQAVMGEPLTVWKTAMDQKRPYLGVSDAMRAIKFIIEQNLFDGEIYNIVSSNHTVREIVDSIKQSIPDVEVELVESEIMNQLSYEVMIGKFSALNFNFIDNIFEHIEQTNKLLYHSHI
jgi:nucleoside-diphosphate-sugar epimerase